MQSEAVKEAVKAVRYFKSYNDRIYPPDGHSKQTAYQVMNDHVDVILKALEAAQSPARAVEVVTVDAKAGDAAITDAVHLMDYAMRGGHVHKREWQKVINGLLTAPKPDSKPQEVSVEDIAKACIKDWCADYFRMVLLAFEHAAELYPTGVKIVKDKA